MMDWLYNEANDMVMASSQQEKDKVIKIEYDQHIILMMGLGWLYNEANEMVMASSQFAKLLIFVM